MKIYVASFCIVTVRSACVCHVCDAPIEMRFETARFVGRVQKIVSGSGLWVRFRYLEHVVHEASTYA